MTTGAFCTLLADDTPVNIQHEDKSKSRYNAAIKLRETRYIVDEYYYSDFLQGFVLEAHDER